MLDKTTSPTTWWHLLEPASASNESNFDAVELFRVEPKIRNVRTIRSLALFTTEVFALVLSSYLAYILSIYLRHYIGTDPSRALIPDSRIIQFTIFVLPILLVLWNSLQADHYRTCKPLGTEVRAYLRSIIFSAAATAIVLFLINGHFSRILFVSFLAFAAILLPLIRYLCKSTLMSFNVWYVPAAIFGTGANAKKVSDTIKANRWLGLEVVAFIKTTESGKVEVPMNGVIDSTADQRYQTLKFGQPNIIFAPETQQEYEDNKPLISHINSIAKTVTIVPPFYGLPLGGAEILHIPESDAMLLSLKNNALKLPNIFIKRVFDIFVATIALTLFSPIFLVICVLLKSQGSPVFFGHTRIGRNNKPFKCLKFQTMLPDSDKILENHLARHPQARKEWEKDFKLKNDPRVTRVGQFLRKTSLDELPQFINVLRNEMGLVGPRPIVVDEQVRYGEMLPYYLSINPGITGLWQTSGRNNTTYDERVGLDVWYARNWSFWLDIVILFKTIPAVLKSDGAY